MFWQKFIKHVCKLEIFLFLTLQHAHLFEKTTPTKSNHMKKIFISAAVILVSVFAVIMIVGATGSSGETKKESTELTGTCAKTAAACCDTASKDADCDKTALAHDHCDPASCAKPDCCKSSATGDHTKAAGACAKTAEAKACNPATCASHK